MPRVRPQTLRPFLGLSVVLVHSTSSAPRPASWPLLPRPPLAFDCWPLGSRPFGRRSLLGHWLLFRLHRIRFFHRPKQPLRFTLAQFAPVPLSHALEQNSADAHAHQPLHFIA